MNDELTVNDEPRPEATTIAGEAYGVGVVIEAPDPDLMGRMAELVPPGWRERDPGPDDPRFAITTEDGVVYAAERDGVVLTTGELDVVLGLFDTFVRNHVALKAPDRIFVHAGAVAYRGRGIVIPGRSFSGKTTLVAQLLAAGATYYSDEYAVLDEQGLLHPFPKPLSLRLRAGKREQTNHPVGDLGGVAGSESVPVALIVATQYRAGGEWQPSELTPGDAVLELFANAIPVNERPQESLTAFRHAVQRATAVKGPRGEAAEIVPWLLQRVGAPPAVSAGSAQASAS